MVEKADIYGAGMPHPEISPMHGKSKYGRWGNLALIYLCNVWSNDYFVVLSWQRTQSYMVFYNPPLVSYSYKDTTTLEQNSEKQQATLKQKSKITTHAIDWKKNKNNQICICSQLYT